MQNYKTAAFLYGSTVFDAVTSVEAAWLDKYDYLVLDPYSTYDLESLDVGIIPVATRNVLLAKSLAYWDPWATSYYTDPGTIGIWQGGPGDYGDPHVTLTGNAHFFHMTDRHMNRIISTEIPTLFRAASTRHFGGVFLDDFGYDKDELDEVSGTKADIWSPHDTKAGYGLDDWNKTRMDLLNQQVRQFVYSRVGRFDTVLQNGSTPIRMGPRLWEGVGAAHSRATLLANGVAGDWVICQTLGHDGTWYIVKLGDDEEAEIGVGNTMEDYFAQLAVDAAQYGFILCKSYRNKPLGMSIYSLIEDIDTWPGGA